MWRQESSLGSVFLEMEDQGSSFIHLLIHSNELVGEQEGEKDKVLAPKGAHSSGRDRDHKHANKAISAHENEKKIE